MSGIPETYARFGPIAGPIMWQQHKLIAGLGKESEAMKAENGDLRELLAEVRDALLDARGEVIRLRAENEALKKCCTQRGARMQIMRDWIVNGEEVNWLSFAHFNPGADAWFDADGVPVRGEQENQRMEETDAL